MKFSGEGYIVVSGNNFTLTNSIELCTSYAKAGTTNRYGQVTNNGTISGLTITNSYFECNKNYCYGCIATSDIVSNVVIKGNFLQSTYDTGSVNECIQLYTIDGTIEVSENTIMFDTTNFVIYMGSTGCSCSSVVIKDNHISGYKGNTAGISVRNMPATCKLDIVHNYIIGMSGNLLDSKTSKAGAVVNVMYNYFETSFKYTNVGEATVNYEGNSYFAAQTTATSDYQAYEEYDLEALEEAYAALGLPTISYDLDGGEWGEVEGLTKLAEGQTYVPPTPVKAGFEFAGWYEGETKVTECSGKSYTLVAHWAPAGLYVGTGEYGEYGTVASALAAAQKGDIIRVYPGTYAESFTVSVEGVTITSVDPESLAVITGKITVSANDVVIDGLEFTGAAGVTTTGFDGLQFVNNYVHDTAKNSAAWVETSVQTIGFVKVIGAQTNQVENTVIMGNKFENVLDSCVFVICPNGLIVAENEFTDFAYEAIRLDGGYSNGQIVITNNKMVQTTKGAYNGIYMRAYSNYTSGDNKEIVYIAGNEFKNIGWATSTSPFLGAICARNNQEHGVQFIIKHNDFENCYRYVRIRNQADNLANFNSFKWSLIIENNNFYGLPADFYFNNRNASDNGSANPSLAVIGANYYTNDAKEMITVNPDMFQGVANTEFVSLETPVVHGEIKNEVTYDIHYVAEGATVEAPETAKIGSTVTLPTLTKAEYFFVGWFLDEACEGEPLTELANVKEDMTVYAKFAAYEYKTISYELDGAALPEGAPEEFVIGIGATLPIPTKEGFNFLGWFDNAECAGAAITAISAEEDSDVTVYALWQDLSATYDVTFNLNGGSLQYKNYQEVAADFLKDMNAVNGTTEFTGANFESKVRNPQFTAFLADDAMWAKWSWLFAYMQANDKNGSSVAIYEEVMTKRTCLDTNWWFLTRDFSGFVNKKVGNFYYSVSPMDWTTYDLAEGIWAAMPKTVTQTDIQGLPTPIRPYYTFLGWYETPDFSGQEVKVLLKDTTLYAKWEKTTVKLTYVLNNEQASLAETEVAIHASQAFDLPTPTFPAKYFVFEGWFTDAKLTQPISSIAQYTTAPVTVYAKWTEIEGYTINYVLNGGSIKYADRNAVLADFIGDYNSQMNKSYALDGSDMPTGAWDEINFHTFYEKVLPGGVSVREKWLWLAEYLLELSQRDLASNNCNVTGLKKLVGSATPAYSGDDTYGLSYAFRSFLAASIVRPNSSYTSVDYTIYANAHGFWAKLSAAENGKYLNNKGTVTLPTAYLENYQFAGWYNNPELSGSAITTLDGELDSYTLYAKFIEATPVTAVNFTNVPAELKRFEKLQATWEVLPAEANIKGVTFSSSNTSVVTIDKQGYITAVGCGTATITIKSESASGVSSQLQVVVYAPGHFNISYETESYTTVGGTLQLNAEYVNRDGSLANVSWESLNESIATVNAGIVTAVAEGVATIRAKVEGSETEYIDFVVTVLPEGLDAALSQVVDAHQSNAFTSYDLGIGAGTPAYYRDIIGSVSTLLYNKPLEINRQYEAAQAKQTENHGGAMSSVEFITVHYTGNMSPKATAAANADYFSSGGGGTSIHYVTGNDGVFSSLDDTLIGFHAGDGTGTKFQWYPTGVMHQATDPERPVWGISTDSYFTINGQKTTRPVPAGDTAQTKKVTDARWINDMGLAWKIVEGQYYMGTTWWCYSQIAEGRICNHGGNLNSIGIESAVNPESDLWLTWQMTAQLVAQLMVENNLDITRVVGHHFFSAKDCPQPLLENELEIWWEFIEMVKDNYNCITALKDYSMAMSFVGSNSAVDNNGRISMPEYATVITYKVTVTSKTGETEEVTLATAVNGRYTK